MDDLKTVLFVLPATAIGGAETRFFNIMKHIKGVRCVLLTQRAVSGYFSGLGIPVYEFDAYGSYYPMPFSLGKTLNYARAVSDVAKREGVACIIGIMHTGSFYASAARDIFRLKIAVISNCINRRLTCSRH